MPRAHRDHGTAAFDQALDALRSDVIARCGFQIKTIKECEILRLEMQEYDPRFTLGMSTLRRFFKLLPSDNQFSITTLNALARFARKNGFEQYLHAAEARLVQLGSIHWELALTKRLAYPPPPPLADMLHEINREEYTQISGHYFDGLIHRLVEAYERGLSQHEISEILAHPRSRRIVMEMAPPLSWMNGFGSRMFEQFLEAAEREEERLFASRVLASHALFSGNHREARTLLDGTETRVSSEIHILPATRVLGLHWLLAALEGNEAEMAHRWERIEAGYRLKQQVAVPYNPYVEIHFCSLMTRWLLLAPIGEHMLARLEAHLACMQALKNRRDLHVAARAQLGLLNIGEAWTLFRCGQIPAARRAFAALNPDGHLPFEAAFGRLFYHVLGEHLDPEKPHHTERAEAEANRSGHSWLLQQLRLPRA